MPVSAVLYCVSQYRMQRMVRVPLSVVVVWAQVGAARLALPDGTCARTTAKIHDLISPTPWYGP